jgi:uncharacterized coiled-coil protein SlyX
MRVDVRDQQARLNVFGQPTTSERPRRTALLPFSLAAIAAIALAWGCYLLFSYGRPIELDSTRVVAAARTADPGVTREDFQALQQKTATELEAMGQYIEADLQKLSDQVSALAAKVDALQDAAAAGSNARAQAPTKKSSKPTAN